MGQLASSRQARTFEMSSCLTFLVCLHLAVDEDGATRDNVRDNAETIARLASRSPNKYSFVRPS